MNCGWAAAVEPTVPFANIEPYTNTLRFAAPPNVSKLATENATTLNCVLVPPPAAAGATETKAFIVTPVTGFIITTVSLRLITPIVCIGAVWPAPATGETLAVVGTWIIPIAAAPALTTEHPV